MKLSEDEDYLRYGESLAEGDFDAALASLQLCIEKARQAGSTAEQAFLIGLEGNVELERGDSAKARSKFEEAERVDNYSPWILYSIARYIFEYMKDYKSTIERCDRIIERSTHQPWPKTEFDEGSNYYIACAAALRARCHLALNNMSRVERDVKLLLSINDKMALDSAFDLHTDLANADQISDVARQYLEQLAELLAPEERKKDSESNQEN